MRGEPAGELFSFRDALSMTDDRGDSPAQGCHHSPFGIMIGLPARPARGDRLR